VGAVQYLIQSRAGTVYLDCPAGRPSVATVTIKTAGGGEVPSSPVSGASATVDPLTRAVQTWSASTPRSITLAAGSGTLAIGRDYQARWANGKREMCRTIGVATNTIEIADELPYPLTTSDYVESTRCTYALTTAQTANRGLYRCEWVTTVASVVYVYETLFRIARSLPVNPGTAAGLRAYSPELCSRFDQFVQREGSWTARIASAWDKLLAEVEGRGEQVFDRIVDWTQAEPVIYERVLLDMAATKRPSDDWSPVDWIAERRSEYKAALETWMASVRWYDDADAGRVQSPDEAGRDLVSIRMRR